MTLGVVAAVLLIAFEAMAVATAMPVAARELDGLGLYAWGFSGFLVTSLYGMVLAGEVGDRRGPRLPFLGGMGAFAAGLLLAGAAPSMLVLVLGRAVQGLGGGLVIVAVYLMVARAYPEGLRPRVFAAMSGAWVVPSIVGPAVAGWTAEALTWRLVFLAVAPLVLLVTAVVLPGLRRLDGPSPDAVPRRRRKRLALGAAAGAALVQWAGTHLGWAGLAGVVAGGGLLVLCVPRLLPTGTLRGVRGLPTTIALRGVLAGAFFGAETFVPLMLVTERGLSAGLAGLSLTGAALGWAAGSWYQGRPATRWPRHRLVQAGSALVALGIVGVAAAVAPGVPVATAAAAWALGGLGMGLALTTLSVLTLAQSRPADQGANSAALQVSDALGAVGLIGVGGALYAALRTGAGQDAEVFVIVYAVMVAVAVLGTLLAGRVTVRDARPLRA